MLEILHAYGDVAVVGRQGSSGCGISRNAGIRRPRRVPTGGRARARRAAFPRARRPADEGRLGGAPRRDGGQVPDASRSFAVRPADPRPRPRRGALRLPLPPRDVRPKGEREYGYYVLPILVGDRLVGRIEPRFDRKTRRSRCSARGETPRGADEALASLATFLGAERSRDTQLGSRGGFETRAIHEGQEPDPRPARSRRRSTRRGPTCRRRRRPQGVRLRTRRQPDANSAPGEHRLARGRGARPRVHLRPRRGDDADAPALPG